MSGIVGNNTARASGVIAGASADFVKIATCEVTGSTVASIEIQGCFTSTYDSYQIHFNRLDFTGNGWLYPLFLDDSNATLTTTYYTKAHKLYGDYNGDSEGSWNTSNTAGIPLTNTFYSNRDNLTTSGIIYLPDPRSTRTPVDGYKSFWYTIIGGASGQYWRMDGMCQQSITTPYGGIQFKGSSQHISVGFKATVYGLKT